MTHPFLKVRNARGHPEPNLWIRNKLFYVQIRMGGHSAAKIPLPDCKTVPQARQARNKLLLQRKEGLTRAILTRVPKFKECVAHYLEFIDGDKRPATIEKEASCLAGWSAQIGELRLNAITPLHVDDYLQERKATVCGRTRDLDILTLNALLKWGQRRGYLTKLPTAHHEKLGKPPPSRPLPEPAQLLILCNSALTCRNGRQLADYLLLLAFCGARRDEALRLRKRDIDWTNRKLHIGADGLAKNHLSRHVDFNDELERHLRQMATYVDPLSEWLFPSRRRAKGDARVTSFREGFESARNKAGFPEMQIHDLRHFFISFCLRSGVMPVTVAMWVGHQDGGVLIGKTYAHLLPSHTKADAEQVVFMPAVVEDKRQLKLI